MAKSIAIIGDSESIKGFGAVGMELFICDGPTTSPQLLKQLTENDYYAIIYMTEEIFTACAREREKFVERPTPAMIPLPGARGNSGIGQRRLSSFVEQAVGSDILFKN